MIEEVGGDDPRGRSAAAGDAVSLAYLVVALAVTVWFDGGLDAGGALVLGGTALLVVPVVFTEASRSSPSVRLLLLSWGLGIVVSLTFAVHRADMTEAILTYCLPPFAFLAAGRLYRQPWGPVAVVAILAASGAVYWGHALLSWTGPPLEHMRSNWLAVFWHNPTGALMGSFGLLSAALSVRARLRWAVPAGAAAALALAGLWLTGSRGAMIATALGLTVTLVASREVGWARLASATGAVLVGAALAGAVLLQVGGIRTPGDAQQERVAPAERDEPELVRIHQSAEGNLRARFAHMDAGMELFSDHPVTGAGMGAYGELGNRRASPGANLTLSAHNEFVEALAEGGLLFGVPFLAAGLTIAGLAFRRVRRHSGNGRVLEPGLLAGSAGVSVLLLVHTAADIDWRYPVIPALLAVSAAVMIGPARSRSVPAQRGLVTVPLVIALALGVAAAGTETWTRAARAVDDSELPLPAAPWDLHRRVEAARVLADGGDIRAARRVLEPAERWSPKSPSIDVMQATVAYRAGDLTVEELTSSLDGQRTGASAYVLVAEALLVDGHRQRTSEVVEEGFALTSEHGGTPYARAELWELRVRHAAATGDCDQAVRLASEASSDVYVDRYVDDIDERLAAVLTDEGCPGT